MRLPRAFAYITALFALAALTGLVGCAQGSGPTAPATTPDLTAEATPPVGSANEGVVLGYYQFVFDDDGTVRVEEAEPVRGAEFNVTPWAWMVIEDFFFDRDERNWYITATIKNISTITGYDVWVVFHSLGNKFVVNQDGFMWALPPIFPEPTRLPFIAFGKDQPDRAFPPMFQDTRTVVIHQPEGVPKLAPLGFWIDATLKPRKTPGVENLAVEAIDETTYQLTGFVWDHQSPPSELTVWADTSSFNGNPYEPLYDDGNHGDGKAADNIFGCTFSGDPEERFYVITVYAFDPQGNQGENDVGFWHGEGPCDKPFEYYPFQTIEIGEHSGIQWLEEVVINDWEAWEEVWTVHKSIFIPSPPPPPINFEMHTVIGVWVGERPSNNHRAEIQSVYYDPCEDLVTVLYNYTPRHEACGPLDVITHPFHIIILPKFEHPVYFVGEEVPCPGPPPECVEEMPIHTVVHGIHSGIKQPYELRIGNQEHFLMLWQEHTKNMWPPPPPPEINWDMHDLVAVATGERNTGGFECNIYRLCWLVDGGIGAFYVERIPGPDCDVPHVFTQPYHWVLIPKVDCPVHFFRHSEVYSCGPGDCEEPLLFRPIDEGTHTGHPPGEFVFRGPDAFEDFWWEHKGPGGPPPPPIHWEREMALAMLIGERPSTGYYVDTVEVCLNGIDDPGTPPHIDVTCIEFQPGEDCDVLWVITQPYEIIVVPRFDVPVFFHHEVEVYDCPPCEEVPWYQLADGHHSCAERGEYGFQGFTQEFEDLWVEIHCGDAPPLPPVPDPINPGWEIKPFMVQLDPRPTTGYYLMIDDVCLDGCDAFVTYTEWIPGPGCPVAGIETQPWVFGVAEFPPIDCEIVWHFEKQERVYECPPCHPVPFYKIAEGDHSCAEPGEYGWQYQDSYVQFWYDVNCYDPGSGDPPPPLPGDPELIEDGIIYHFGVQLDERPSTGYYITFDYVCIEGCDVFIDYTEHIPGENCDVEPIVTMPWAIGAVELPPVYCYWSWHFERHEEVYDCPDDCWDFEDVAGGEFQECGGPGGWLIDNPEGWEHYWRDCHPDHPIPPINFDGGWGAYVIHLGERPTTGFEVEVFEICPSEDPFGAAVRWIEWIPGDTCEVEPVVTYPWRVVTMPLVDLPYFDEGFEEVYECD